MPSPRTDDPTPMPREFIRERIRDHMNSEVQRERDELVALWRKAYPEAATETSPVFHPLVLFWTKPAGGAPSDPDERWTSDRYLVTVRRFAVDRVFGSRGGMIQLGICSHDGSARHDWRDLQAIKNQLAGPETEAFELYPAESRLLDPSNYYTLWCFPGLKRLKVGQELRRVLDAEDAPAPQRALPVPVEPAPIPMVLHCPNCATQHIDAPEPQNGWTNPPHKSHLCEACGLIWRPCDVATTGVASIETRGKADTWPEPIEQ